jgi:hypothetical protein
MRPFDSAYDRNTAEQRGADPGAARYGLIRLHNGPCSLVEDFDCLDAAIEAARTMDTDAAPTELEDEIDYDGTNDRDDRGLIAAAQAAGWKVVATAPAGEYWAVLAEAGRYYEQQIIPAHGGFGEYEAAPINGEGYQDEADLEDEMRQGVADQGGEMVELADGAELPDWAEDIRGRIRNQPERVFAVRDGEQVRYVGIAAK